MLLQKDLYLKYSVNVRGGSINVQKNVHYLCAFDFSEMTHDITFYKISSVALGTSELDASICHLYKFQIIDITDYESINVASLKNLFCDN